MMPYSFSYYVKGYEPQAFNIMLTNDDFIHTDIGDTRRLINADSRLIGKLTELKRQAFSLDLNAHSSNVFMESMELGGAAPQLESTIKKHRPNLIGRYSLDLEDLIKEHSSLIGSTQSESKKFFGSTYLDLAKYAKGTSGGIRATVSFTKDTGVAQGVAKGTEGIMSAGTVSRILESGEIASKVMRGIL